MVTWGVRDGAQVSGLTEGCTVIDTIHTEEEAQTTGKTIGSDWTY